MKEPMKCMKWIVLSDMHFQVGSYDIARLRNKLVDKVRELGPGFDFILMTGDFFYQNKAPDDTVQEMAKFIKRIGRVCGVTGGRIYMCRGNHDIDRNNAERNKLVKKARKNNSLTDSDVHGLESIGSENFRTLFKAVRGSRSKYSPFAVVTPTKLPIRIAFIDSCLLSKDDSDFGKLRVRVPELEAMATDIQDDDRLNIVMMHHGIECLEARDARKISHWVDDNSIDVVFCGHAHRAAMTHLDDVRRDVLQFTTGALTIDDYAIPSFYYCEGNATVGVDINLYTFSEDMDDWVVDDHHLRSFGTGGRVHVAPTRRVEPISEDDETMASDGCDLEEGRSACEEVVRSLNARYSAKYRSRRIISSKTDAEEDFDAWRIVSSLAGVGIPYPTSLALACETVEEMTSDSYSADNILSSTQIKAVIYDTILRSRSYPEGTSGYEIGMWASQYARHYSKEKGIELINGDKRERLSYSLLRDSLLKEVVVDITGSELNYQIMYTSEKEAMADAVIRFIKGLGVFELRRDILLALIREYMTERPHPWFVTLNRDDIIAYHIGQVDMHLEMLSEEPSEIHPVRQVEAAYHVCAALLARYSEYTGCKEVSPISILHHALRRVGQKNDSNLPMLRYRLVQLQKDLESVGSSVEELGKSLDVVYDNIVSHRTVDDPITATKLRELRHVLDDLPRHSEAWVPIEGDMQFDAVASLFKGAEGFEVRQPLQYFGSRAFFVSPNWTEDVKKSYGLGRDMLVCMLKREHVHGVPGANRGYQSSQAVGKLARYLSIENKNGVREVVFFKDNVSEFTPIERDEIRRKLKSKGKTVLCVFIQERDFEYVTENGWRSELFEVVKKSRYSR